MAWRRFCGQCKPDRPCSNWGLAFWACGFLVLPRQVPFCSSRLGVSKPREPVSIGILAFLPFCQGKGVLGTSTCPGPFEAGTPGKPYGLITVAGPLLSSPKVGAGPERKPSETPLASARCGQRGTGSSAEAALVARV